MQQDAAGNIITKVTPSTVEEKRKFVEMVEKGAGSTAYSKTLGMSNEQVKVQAARLCMHKKYLELYDEMKKIYLEKKDGVTPERNAEIMDRLRELRQSIKELSKELRDGSQQEIEE